MTRYAIALGSNQGGRVDRLRQAVAELEGLGTIEAISGLYETEPVGGPAQDPFLNAVVLLDTDLAPAKLLATLQQIETANDRVRTVRWGPRTLDLDIVAVGDQVIDTPDLQVPHPRAAERLFVLQPLCDVWPEAMVGDGLTAAEALSAVSGQVADLVAADW
ncbi:MAG TPA: 2-amino-4-hydroxy-6-hydroxymethyldihydropteridine diphosphokinase [Acidimicrobiia bacterium]|nr:2-amino-4-hydroxy-6-hydroxymethyldihydropteridine diphosphokinase [Acidimicrobiia bacterium]